MAWVGEVNLTDQDGATSRCPEEGLAAVAKEMAEVTATVDVRRTVRTARRSEGSAGSDARSLEAVMNLLRIACECGKRETYGGPS